MPARYVLRRLRLYSIQQLVRWSVRKPKGLLFLIRKLADVCSSRHLARLRQRVLLHPRGSIRACYQSSLHCTADSVSSFHATGFLNMPIPSMSTSHTSPCVSRETPEGVPVAIRSPGNSVIILEMYRIKKSTEKTIWLVRPSCFTTPLTR